MDKLFWLGGKSDNCPQNVLFGKKHIMFMNYAVQGKESVGFMPIHHGGLFIL